MCFDLWLNWNVLSLLFLKVLYDGHHDDHHEHHGHHGGGGLEEHFHNKINHVKDFIHAKHPKGHPSEYLHG